MGWYTLVWDGPIRNGVRQDGTGLGHVITKEMLLIPGNAGISASIIYKTSLSQGVNRQMNTFQSVAYRVLYNPKHKLIADIYVVCSSLINLLSHRW